jgi:hypothetical protein
MSELKMFKVESGWLEFELDTKLPFDPPVIKVRVRMLTDLDTVDAYGDGARKLSAVTLSRALAAIVEWDLVQDGKPLPCTDEVKDEYGPQLKMLLAQPLKALEGATMPRHLAMEILKAAQDEGTFLKN